MTTHASAAPNPLDEALARLINRSVDAAESVAGGISQATGDATAFLVAEIPDVIQQLLVWHAIESLIWFLLGTLILASPWFVYWRWGGRGEPTGETDYNGDFRYKKTLTHHRDGDINQDGALALTLGGVGATIAGFLLTMNSLEWLQILVAPKLYLLEYAREIIR